MRSEQEKATRELHRLSCASRSLLCASPPRSRPHLPPNALPSLPLVVSLKIRDVLEDQVLGLVISDDSQNLEIQAAELRVVEAKLIAGLGEWLARKPGAKDLVGRYVSNIDLSYVPDSIHAEIRSIQLTDGDGWKARVTGAP